MNETADQFQRTELLLGSSNMKLLKNRRVAVFGVGGVGGHAAEALCRSGIGMIDVYDGDVVDITNINRQIIALHKNIGRDKVEVMCERLLEINPEVVVGALKLFYLPDTADSVDLTVYDYIIDAVDTMTAKIELVSRAKSAGIPIICSMGAANKLDPAAFEVSDIFKTSVCPMARIMRNELRKRNIKDLKVVYSKEPPIIRPSTSNQTQLSDDQTPLSDGQTPLSANQTPSPAAHSSRPLPASIAFVPPVAGLILAGEVIKDLTNPLSF